MQHTIFFLHGIVEKILIVPSNNEVVQLLTPHTDDQYVEPVTGFIGQHHLCILLQTVQFSRGGHPMTWINSVKYDSMVILIRNLTIIFTETFKHT